MTDDRWPARLLSQNSDMRRSGIWNWTIPAHTVRLSDGSWFNACPNAGACGRVCYAKFGAYRFSNVARRHLQNLEMILEAGDLWERRMVEELSHKRFKPSQITHRLPTPPGDDWLEWWRDEGGRAIRIHDAGDFFSEAYLDRWIRIAFAHPHILFYAYTKEVAMLEGAILPDNMRVLYSFGGKQDHLIDRDRHRHADVFPSLETLESRGYADQGENDLLAICHPNHRIGIVRNNLPVAIRRFDGKAMSEI